MPKTDYIVDDAVLHAARLQLEQAARLLASIENFYFACEADEVRYTKKLSEALANIHAAEARLR